MWHAPARIGLVFALLIGLLPCFTSAQAQPASNTLKPVTTDIPVRAFHPSADRGITAAGIPPLQTGVMTAPTLFTDMLFHWQAPTPDAASLQLMVRVSDDGHNWSPWGVIEPSDDLLDPADPPHSVWSEPIYAGEARFYQLRVTSPSGAGGLLHSLDTIQVHTVDARRGDVIAQQVSSSDDDNDSKIPPPPYVSRTAWGNPDGEKAPDAPPKYRTATHLIVHHTADPNVLHSGETDWADRVRAIWAFHTYSRDWGDIGYNWLIDPNGVIYAGRAGSTKSNRDAVGFHDTANYGSMGVALIGTYDAVVPSSAAQDSLVNLLTWKARQRSIDPLGSSYYAGCARSPYCERHNEEAVVPNIAGHRQVIPGRTACPGDTFMEILPAIRQRVAHGLP
jgi:hypothetical protein